MLATDDRRLVPRLSGRLLGIAATVRGRSFFGRGCVVGTRQGHGGVRRTGGLLRRPEDEATAMIPLATS
jgi:hypothetical protein